MQAIIVVFVRDSHAWKKLVVRVIFVGKLVVDLLLHIRFVSVFVACVVGKSVVDFLQHIMAVFVFVVCVA
jgi:hypothetical protein